MLASGAGHIVNITTSLVDQPVNVPSVLASLTKGGLNSATKSLAIEYAEPRHPRQRRRAGHHQDADARGRDARLRSPACTRSGGWARPATWSTRSSTWSPRRFVTGEILHVDGGQNAGH